MSNVSLSKLGSDYGRHFVDLDMINSNSIVYSLGIGEDITFDEELINAKGCKIFAYDPTPKAINHIKNKNNPFIKFKDIGVSDFDGVSSFDPPPKPEYASYKESENGSFFFQVQKVKTIMEDNNHDRIDLLKMDIEGSEYKVMLDIIKDEIFPTQIVGEFHGQKCADWLMKNSIDKYYKIISITPNDFCMIKI